MIDEDETKEERMDLEYTNCKVCGKKFIRIRGGKEQICSILCKEEHRKSNTSICLTCYRPFETKKGKVYCSKKCDPSARIIKKTCPICSKIFYTYTNRQKYCHNPCNEKYKSEERDKYFLFVEIGRIRSEFWRLLKRNPLKALELEEDMKREEGEQFTNLALDGITSTEEFNTLKETQEKYKFMWDGEDNDTQQ